MQGEHEHANKLSGRVAMINQKLEQRRIGLKKANEFVRSSQVQQEERRHRLKKQAQKQTRKMAATQKKKQTSRSGAQKKKKTYAAGAKQRAAAPALNEAPQNN